MLIKILIAIAALLFVFVVIVALRPSAFQVMRSAAIAAPPEVVFAQVNDLHHWEAWSPWAKLDPTARNTYDGAPSGVGAGFGWSGNAKVGEGHMTITESRPYELIKFRLDFVKPFRGTNIAEFTFKPEGNQTAVTWTMSGECNFFAKALGLFVNCDKMVGAQFQQGLAQLNAVAGATVRT
jgi:uncharacterized protein YndB with AHSA1/START domain